MFTVFRAGLIVLALGAVIPNVVEAQLLGRHSHRCCRKCTRPMPECCCPPVVAPVVTPAVVPQTTLQPVVETRYRQESVVTHRDVVETHVRREAYLETVPVTCFENVTVDEGGYQQVWVPKLVTKQVPKTVYQQRVASRDVPYQVTRRIPEVCTRAVPVQTVRYVPTTTCVTVDPCLTGAAAVPGAYPAVSSYPLPPNNYASQPVTTSPTVAFNAPAPAAVPVERLPLPLPAPRNTAQGPQLGLVPQADALDTPSVGAPYEATYGDVQPIPAKGARAQDELGDFRLTSESAPAATATSGEKLFVPAPSAASVWRTPRNTTVR